MLTTDKERRIVERIRQRTCKCGAPAVVYYCNGVYMCLACHYAHQEKKDRKAAAKEQANENQS